MSSDFEHEGCRLVRCTGPIERIVAQLEEEEEEEADEDDGSKAADGDKGADGSDGRDPSVLMQESEVHVTNLSPRGRRKAHSWDVGPAAKAEVSLSHTASQPTLAAHGPQWAASCRSALALKQARTDQAKTWQAARKRKPPQKAPAQPESSERILKKSLRVNAK